MTFEIAPCGLRADALLLPGPTIRLDPRLDRRQRRAALAHELVHLERGGGVTCAGMPATWVPLRQREEQRVNREVARRLVPPAELDALVESRRSVGPVTSEVVADEFDVPEWVAGIALDMSHGRSRVAS